MERETAAEKRAWRLAASGGVVILALLLTLFRAPRNPPPPRATARPTVGLASDPALSEEAMLFDPTPLFLPTEWNSAEIDKDLAGRDLTGGFGSYRPMYFFGEDRLALDLPEPIAAPVRPSDALAGGGPGRPFLGFGRLDRPPPALAARGAFVEVVEAGTGRPVLAQVLAGARPPRGAGLWQPLEFLAAVDSAGLVGQPELTAGSGVEEVDRYFRGYLADTLRLGQRLAPGFYRITVGP